MRRGKKCPLVKLRREHKSGVPPPKAEEAGRRLRVLQAEKERKQIAKRTAMLTTLAYGQWEKEDAGGRRTNELKAARAELQDAEIKVRDIQRAIAAGSNGDDINLWARDVSRCAEDACYAAEERFSRLERRQRGE